MYVCMYVCRYVCVCMYVCMYVYVCVCVWVGGKEANNDHIFIHQCAHCQWILYVYYTLAECNRFAQTGTDIYGGLFSVHPNTVLSLLKQYEFYTQF